VYSTQAASQELERSFAWLGNFRRLLIRWERLFSVSRSEFAFAVMLLCVAVCAPSDCPRVPDPVELSRARAVDAARSVQPSWSTNGSGPHQRVC
jgi:hypothetical protein